MLAVYLGMELLGDRVSIYLLEQMSVFQSGFTHFHTIQECREVLVASGQLLELSVFQCFVLIQWSVTTSWRRWDPPRLKFTQRGGCGG